MQSPSVDDRTTQAIERATAPDGYLDPDTLQAELQRQDFGSPTCPGARDANGALALPLDEQPDAAVTVLDVTPENAAADILDQDFEARESLRIAHTKVISRLISFPEKPDVAADKAESAQAEASEIVPALPPLIAMLSKLADGDLVACGADVNGIIARTQRDHENELRPIRDRHAAELAPHIELKNAVRAEIEKRTAANFESLAGTTIKQLFALASAAGYEAGIEIEREREKRIDVLRRLEGKVTAQEFKDAVYQEPMPKPEDLEWKAHLGKLNALTKKYGEKSEIGKIIIEGTPVREKSRRVFFREIPTEPKNVTNTALGDVA